MVALQLGLIKVSLIEVEWIGRIGIVTFLNFLHK